MDLICIYLKTFREIKGNTHWRILPLALTLNELLEAGNADPILL